MQKDLTVDAFTYYGDLVGISSLYASSPQGAYNALNEYYNEVFSGLVAFYSGHPSRKVEMFSDSLVVRGDDPALFIKTMSPVYGILLSKGLLLRGGMVRGKFDLDVRVTAGNFGKWLPNSDALARAAGMERIAKGARFLVESSLAVSLMPPRPSWLSPQGYFNDPQPGHRDLIFQRSLTPLGGGAAWEVLYPVLAEIEDVQIDAWIERLDYLALVAGDEFSKHHKETQSLLKHSKIRLSHHRGEP
jgi:hypothetical protein